MGLIGPHRVDGPIMLVEYLEIEHPTWRDLETDRTILVNRHDAVDLLDGQRTCDAGDEPLDNCSVAPGNISCRCGRFTFIANYFIIRHSNSVSNSVMPPQNKVHLRRSQVALKRG